MIATWQHRRKAVADAAAASAQETAALTSDSARYMDKAFKIWSFTETALTSIIIYHGNVGSMCGTLFHMHMHVQQPDEVVEFHN